MSIGVDITMKFKKKIEKTRDDLFKMEEQIRKINGYVICTSSNEAPKLAIKKCIELCNYLLGNIKEFNIPFDEKQEETEDNDDGDYEEDCL